MRTIISSSAVAFASALMAQCVHDPVITPNNLMLCPGDTAVLSTQPGDAYQWYRNQTLMPGATDQTLQVTGGFDAGSNFEVHVVLDSCLEFSPLIVVGGYALLQPLVFWSGLPLFTDSVGLHFCEGSDPLLILQAPYDTNITWTNDSSVIAGATNDTLQVTVDGIYGVSASAAACPSVSTTLITPVSIVFEPQQVASIVQVDSLLCALPPGNSYAWYINGIPVFNGTDQCISASFIGGSYTVIVDYGSPCQGISDPFVVVDVAELAARPGIRIWPNPTSDILNISSTSHAALGHWSLVDLSGRELRKGAAQSGATTIPMGGLVPGNYILRVEGQQAAMVIVL